MHSRTLLFSHLVSRKTGAVAPHRSSATDRTHDCELHSDGVNGRHAAAATRPSDGVTGQDRTGQSDERERRQQSTCSFLLRVGKWPDSLTRAKWGAGPGASGGGELSAQALEPGCREPHPILTWRDRRQCKSFPQTVMQRGWVTMRFVKIRTSYSFVDGAIFLN